MDDTGRGRLAVIIGGGNGIGATTARLMATRGWRLAIIDRDLEAARTIAAELHARAFHGDVTDAAVMHGLAQEIQSTLAPPYGRSVEPNEVAETIEFLLSDRASAITGVNLTIDCGWAAARGWVMYGGVRPAPGA